MKDFEVLLVGGLGGHAEQLKRLRRRIAARVKVIGEVGLDWKFDDDVWHASRVVDYHKPSFSQSAIRFTLGMVVALRVIRKSNIRLLISTGPAIAVPACIVAKIHGIKVVHIESWSRIYTVSKTTKLMRRFRLADVVVYQYKESVLAGEDGCEYWGHF